MKSQVNHMAIQAVHGYTRMPSIFEQHQDFQHIYIYIYNGYLSGLWRFH